MSQRTIASLLVMLFAFLATGSISAQVKKKAPVRKSTTVVKKKLPVKKVAINAQQPIRIKITTDSGVMILKLYDSTPLHRDNFVKLVKAGFYDSLMFHRVIPEFMIQGGDPQSKTASAGSMLGNGGDDMGRIPAEFRKTLYHKKGVLAAARDGNPEKASSACQFYIVEGKKISDAELDMMEARKGIKYTAEQRNVYKTQGGTPFLDQEYTVFGEIESGMEVINKISTAPRDGNNRPFGDIRMKIELLTKSAGKSTGKN
ncbi:MAG: peptidylprolyl isomerase [Ferruginibacter sp.]|nr:peptidylprolyl isomerase [Ferruginibacter sp.]